MWSWDIIQPKAATNYLRDPSFEARAVSTTGNPWTVSGATVTDDESYRGAHGLYYYGGTADFATQAVTLPAEQYAYASVWMRVGDGTAGVKVTTPGGTVLGSATATGSYSWQRVSCRVDLNGNTAVVYKLFATGTTTVTVDACQLEDNLLTTYFDGLEEGCVWTGRMHLSPSFRPASCRSGGIAVPLSTYLHEDSMQGWGRATHSNVMLPFGLQGGSVYQRSVKQSRVGMIVGHISAGAYGMDDLHSAQASLGRLLGSDLTLPQKPVRMLYHSGSNAGAIVPPTLATDVVYEGGLEFNALSGLTLTQVPIRLHAPDPAMQEDAERAATVATMSSTTNMCYKPASSARGFAPVASSALSGVLCGTWVTPPYGDSASARLLWLGGSFSSGGYTQVATFDPSTGTLADPGIGGTAGQVNAIVQTGNYLWFAGSFTGFSTFSYLVRYNLSTGAVTRPVSATGVISTLAYDPVRDILYVGGGKALFGAYDNLFEITSASGASPAAASVPWTGLTTGIPGTGVETVAIRDSCVDDDGNLYILQIANGGGAFSRDLWIQKGDGATYTILGSTTQGSVSATPQAGSMVWGPDGALYLAGNFYAMTPGTTVDGLTRWAGGGWEAVRSDLPVIAGSVGRTLAFDSRGVLHTAGEYVGVNGTPGSTSTPGGQTPLDCYLVSGGGSAHVENLTCSPGAYSLAGAPLVFINPSDDGVLFVPNGGTVYYAYPSLLTYGGTAPAPVRFVLSADSTGGVVGGIRNAATGQAIYFTALNLFPYETLYVETAPGAARVYSDQRDDLLSYVAAGSELGSFVLIEGTNGISVLCAGLASGYVTWRNRHYGIDGTASTVVSV
jgi:hypothetical protein